MSNEDIQIDERSGVLYAVVERNGDYVIKADGHRFQVRVESPCKPIKRGYYSDVVRAWDPEVDEPQLARVPLHALARVGRDGERRIRCGPAQAHRTTRERTGVPARRAHARTGPAGAHGRRFRSRRAR